MSKLNIVRAWKDPAYYASLSPEEQALVPANPAGDFTASVDMEQVVGGRSGSVSARLAASCTNKTSTCCNCKPKTAER
ncbi:mersacidin/lichenicidin family type 2 lantibiotic [Shimia ponticola]|uniref:mersacidin/lichenicidin family type 2 lantibiotic n=1 Tax=Shimia ponticola TaxID=2582893 RepID=UPI0011BE137F|nr:mersacidin/lichenicidin family type 2 lantibiotic [Shimia ponticola]